MDDRLDRLDPNLARLDSLLSSAAPSLSPARRTAVERWRTDADALRFHLTFIRGRSARDSTKLLVAVLGGTGTGKSTLVNRLLGRTLSAASFRRTFTSGAVAIIPDGAPKGPNPPLRALPPSWLGVEHVEASGPDLPARGRVDALLVVRAGATPAGAPALPSNFPVLVDTPDLDGDQPAHHAQAERAFRWAQAVLFVVTPEKYQMTELLPYYRLARRYAVPALYVMNKCEEQAVVDDYQDQLERAGFGMPEKGLGTRVQEESSGFRVQTSASSAEPGSGKGEEGANREGEAPAEPGALGHGTGGSGGAHGGEASASPSQEGGSPSSLNPPPEPRALNPVVVPLFVVPRDDATYEPQPDMNLGALRQKLAGVRPSPLNALREGLRNRAGDLLGRLNDQIVAPLRDDRRHADELIQTLRSMEAPVAGVDVNPITRQLHRRLQQRSILYLIGPGRVLDRVRQAPMVLARLPRFAWDYLSSGRVSAELLTPSGGNADRAVPDFRSALTDQFMVLQSRIDDALRSSEAGRHWVGGKGDGTGARAGGAAGAAEAMDKPYAAARINPERAGRIADEELEDLKSWLEQKWNATPRDTRTLESFLSFLPGGKSLARWTEAAPYLLTIVLIVAHHAISGGTDLMLIGGYTLATWLTERLSNEVTVRTRATNTRVEARFADLAHEQINRVCEWLDRQAPSRRLLDELEREAGAITEVMGA